MRRPFNQSPTNNSDDGNLANLTPLLDVLFVILIMFILIAPIVNLDRVDLAQSSSVSTNATSNRQIKIYIRNDNTILIGQQSVSIKQLIIALKELNKTHPEEIPELYPDKNSHFGVYQQIKNSVEDAGFQQMDIILKK